MQRHKVLDHEQQIAVNWNKGSLLVLAGPGSGKTTVIIEHIHFLLQQQISSDAILVITFTKDACNSMQQRFSESTNSIQNIQFCTFHSFFYTILKQHSKFKNFNIISATDKKRILRSLCNKYFEREGYDFNIISEALSLYKNTLNIEKAVKNIPCHNNEQFSNLLKEYQQKLYEMRLLEYDDMLYECLKLLRTDSVYLEHWKNRFQYVLIDEFQDTNPVQYEILKLLFTNKVNLFAVGDDDQSIYGFRGAEPDILQQYISDFHASNIQLKMNYRCQKGIVDASVKVINENQKRFPKELHSARMENEKEKSIAIYSFETKEEQQKYLAQRLKNTIKKGEESTLLFRTNLEMSRYASILKKQGIAYRMEGKELNLYEHPIVKDICAYFKLAIMGYNKETFIQIANKPNRRIYREAIDQAKSLDDIVAWYRNNLEYAAYNEIESIQLLKNQLKQLKQFKSSLGIHYILKVIGYEKYLIIKDKQESRDTEDNNLILEWLKQDMGQYNSFTEWSEYSSNQTKTLSNKNKDSNITLMTFHASKGLEFDTVLIPDCNERNIPHGIFLEESEIEEERRLFYVGMTRAKNNLELLYINNKNSRLPSRFLNPLF